MARLIDVLQMVGERMDHAPTQSDTWKQRIKSDVNQSLDDLSLDAPFPLFERTVTVETAALVDGFDETDTISAADSAVDVPPDEDPWCIMRDTVRTSVATDDRWVTDGTWSGRTLAVQQADETWRLHRIREVFYDAGSDTERMTLYEPMDPDALYDGLVYKVLDTALWLPGNVSRVLSVQIKDPAGPSTLQPMLESQYSGYLAPSTASLVSTGTPRGWYACGRWAMPAPTTAPDATASGVWTGTLEPSGSFQFAYTHCWGYRPGISALQPGAGGAAASRVPLWESAPSPVSTALDLTGGTNGAQLDFTDLAHEQGFRPGSTFPRDNRCGWFRRIYRKRISIKTAGNPVEKPDDYLFLYDLDCDTEPNRYTHLGDVVPDPSVRLPDHSDYFGLGLYPTPDGTYPIEIRYVEQPKRVADDYDTIPLPDNCVSVLVEYVLARHYERTGDIGAAEVARSRARDRLERLSAQRGPVVPHDTVLYRRPARGRGGKDARFGFVGWRIPPTST